MVRCSKAMRKLPISTFVTFWSHIEQLNKPKVNSILITLHTYISPTCFKFSPQLVCALQTTGCTWTLRRVEAVWTTIKGSQYFLLMGLKHHFWNFDTKLVFAISNGIPVNSVAKNSPGSDLVLKIAFNSFTFITLATPFLASFLFSLNFCSSFENLYFVHSCCYLIQAHFTVLQTLIYSCSHWIICQLKWNIFSRFSISRKIEKSKFIPRDVK